MDGEGFLSTFGSIGSELLKLFSVIVNFPVHLFCSDKSSKTGTTKGKGIGKYMFRILTLAIIFVFISVSSANAATTAKDFGTLPQIYDAALSPNGKEIAVLANNNGQYIIRVLELSKPSRTSRLIALGAKIKPKYLKWVNNKRLILSFWQSEEKNHVPVKMGYLYSLNTKSMEGRILVEPPKFDAAAGWSRNSFRQFNNIVVDWLEDDPDYILMAYGDNNNEMPDIHRVNVETGRGARIKRGFRGVQTWHTDLTGEPRIGQGRDGNDGSWVLRIRDADTDKWRFSDEYPGLPADVDIHGFTSNPNHLIISAYQGRDTIGLYIYDLKQKNITDELYHNNSYDASGVILSADGSEVIGASYVSETREIEMLGEYDTALSRMRDLFVGYDIKFVDRSKDGEKILFKASSATNPGSLLMVEKGGSPVSLGKLRPQVSPKDLGVVNGIEYTARDGQKIPSFLTLPPAITDAAQLQNLPFIVLPHGGPYARTSKRFDYFAQFFASLGYAVLQMNFRGSAGYGKTFEETGRQNWVVMQEDVEDGTRWLIEQGLADPKRICIVGWSYGGYAALMGAAKNPDLYSCAVSVAGLTDINDFIQDKKQYRFGKFTAENFIGSGFENKDDVKANSPVKLADQIEVPLLLVHGKHDEVVHFGQFSRMKSALKKAPAKVTYMDFSEGDHYLSFQKDRQDFLVGLEKFLEKSNGKSELMQ